MWKREVSDEFRRVLILRVARLVLGSVCTRRARPERPQHKSMPFGSTSAVSGWHRVGWLLRDMVCIFLVPCFFGVNLVGCEYTGGFCHSQMCSLLGFPTNPKKNAGHATSLTILCAKGGMKQKIAAAVV